MVISGTITVLELAWTVVASIGLTYMLLLLLRSWQDREWLIRTSANGDHKLRTYVAWTSILIFLGGVSTQSAYVITGAIAMTQPSLHPKPHAPQIITSTIFIISSLIGTIFAGVIYHRRTKVVKIISERLENGDLKESEASGTIHA